MGAWDEVCRACPELAAQARDILDGAKHKTIATIRRDGSPRISGTEASFALGELWFGSMPDAVKAKDLLRDPRFALHSASIDPPEWKADAKLAGEVEEVTDVAMKRKVFKALGGGGDPGSSHLFRAKVTEMVVTRLGDPEDHLVIESWHEGRGTRRVERR